MAMKRMTTKGFRLRGVLFDFDGTLTCPGALDFAEIRSAIGCPPGQSILAYIDTIPHADKPRVADLLDQYEMTGAERSIPNPDVESILHYLKSCKLFVGIISRNGIRPVQRALKNFPALGADDFHIIITRDDDIQPKPSGAGIRFAAERFGVRAEELLVVGDYLYDMEAGNQAGAVTALLHHPDTTLSFQAESDFVITSLQDVQEIVRLGLPLPAGKLPNDILAGFLKKLDLADPSVVIPPAIGEDIAAVTVETKSVLVLKSDPITFVTSEMGYYAVLVNANDVVTSGAKPRWFLSSLLFPVGTTSSGVLAVMEELQTACDQWEIALCGGHTEITNAVCQPVVVGMMAGTVAPDCLIDKRNIRKGDLVLLTKRIAVEGTAILAGAMGEKLQQMGIAADQVTAALNLKQNISIIKEAEIASGHPGVSGLHDVTEGGVATAVSELSVAGGHTICIELEKIPCYPETTAICDALGLEPFGLIGSGSLLIACRKEAAHELMGKMAAVGIEINCIGEVRGPGRGVKALLDGREVEWPDFQADEITRAL